jgi:trehalose 6-phosphate phosphatase
MASEHQPGGSAGRMGTDVRSRSSPVGLHEHMISFDTRHMNGGSPSPELLAGASLFLDFDGTLVELAETPDAVRVEARLISLLDALDRCLGGRVAVISGRPAGQVHALLGARRVTVAGSHGLELLHAGGQAEASARPAALTAVLEDMRALARRHPGVLVEDKPLGSALHFRQCPGAEQPCLELAKALADHHGLQLQTGKAMVEVRAGGGDKGTALRRLMELPAMRGTRPVFVGDDDTDEPAFVAAQALGGAGVLVGEARPTAARYRLPGTGAVLDWLEAACRR